MWDIDDDPLLSGDALLFDRDCGVNPRTGEVAPWYPNVILRDLRDEDM
jgi:hypothetical protein